MSTKIVPMLAVALVPLLASAQWGAGAPPEQAPPPTTVAPAPPPAPVPEGAPLAVEPPPRNFWVLSSFNLGVPILLDSDRDVVRPGASLNGRFVFTSRYVGLGIQGGFQWVPIDLGASNDPLARNEGRHPMRRGYLGPIVHLQIPNATGFTPYAQGGFDLNFWNFRESAVVCDYWYCYSQNVYRFAPGIHGRFGGRFAMHPASSFYVDLGVEVGTSFEGDFFIENQPWVTPYFGLGFTN